MPSSSFRWVPRPLSSSAGLGARLASASVTARPYLPATQPERKNRPGIGDQPGEQVQPLAAVLLLEERLAVERSERRPGAQLPGGHRRLIADPEGGRLDRLAQLDGQLQG